MTSQATKTSWGLVLALWGAGLGAAAQYGKISVIFDQLPAIYPEAGAGLGFVVSCVGFVGIVLGVAAGVLVARIRYRRALLLALWIGAGVSAVQSFLPPFHWMLVTRVIEGVSHLAIVVAAPTLIAQITAPKDRGIALTLWGTFFGVAFAVLTFAGLPLVSSAGLSALFLAHAVYLAGFALFLAARLKSLPTEGEIPPFSIAGMLRDHGAIYRSPYTAAPAAGWLFYTFCFVSVLTVLPPYLPAESRALVMGSMPLTSIAVSMTVGVYLLRIMSAVRVVQIGFGLSALAMIWLGAVPHQPWAALSLAAAMGLIQGASFAAVPQLNPTAAAQARANGAMAQMGNIGNTLGTPIMAITTTGIGYIGLPILATAAFLMGLAAHVALAHARHRG